MFMKPLITFVAAWSFSLGPSNLLFTEALAQTETQGVPIPEARPTTASTSSGGEPYEQCTEASSIKKSCSGNPRMQNGVIAQMVARTSTGNGAARDVEQVGAEGVAGANDLQQIMNDCDAAANYCQKICNWAAEQHTNSANLYMQGGPSQAPLVKQELSKVSRAEADFSRCQIEHTASSGMSIDSLTKLAMLGVGVASTILAMRQSSGGGGGSGSKTVTPGFESDFENDINAGECDESNPDSQFLASCMGESDFSTAASRLDGSTGVGTAARSSGRIQGRPGSEGEIREASNSGQGGGNGAGPTAGSAGLAGLGGADLGAASIPVQNGESDTDADIHKGFMGAGGGGGGSGGGYKAASGGQGGKFKPITLSSLKRGKKGNKKVAKASAASGKKGGQAAGARGIAGHGGPYQDNFYIIRKTYKEASSSLKNN